MAECYVRDCIDFECGPASLKNAPLALFFTLGSNPLYQKKAWDKNPMLSFGGA